MEETEKFVIPTLSKTKISRGLSYPIGAEQVSLSLASTPQLLELKLHFYLGFDNQLRWGHYEFLRVEYLKNAKPANEWPIYLFYNRPPQWRWEIIVQPVPRILRHHIKQYIIEMALPRVAQWLKERSQLTRQGSDILAFFFDEKSEEFVVRCLTRLEPER